MPYSRLDTPQTTGASGRSRPLSTSRGEERHPLWGGPGVHRVFALTGPGSASGPCGGRRSSPWGALPRIRTSNLSYASSFHAARAQQDEHWPLGPGAVISKEQRDCGSISKYQRSSHGGGTSEALGTASAPMPMLPTGGSALPRVPT